MATLLKVAGSQIIASPPSWTIARLIAIFPSKADAIPTAPSLPTIAASVISPVSRLMTSDTTALIGKYTDLMVSPASKRMVFCGRCTALRSGIGVAPVDRRECKNSQLPAPSATGRQYPLVALQKFLLGRVADLSIIFLGFRTCLLVGLDPRVRQRSSRR